MTTEAVLQVAMTTEASVVGGMLRAPDLIPSVVERVRPDDFRADRFRRVYEALVALWDDQAAIDEVTLVAKLRERGDLDAAGGLEYVSNLAWQVPSGANVEYHARLLASEGARRRIADTAARIQALAAEPMDPEALQAEAAELLAEAAPKAVGTGLVKVRELLPKMLEDLDAMTTRGSEPQGVRTGIRAVDSKITTLERGDLVIVAGRPSMGKSSFGICNVAADVALRQRRGVAVFSVETNESGITRRLLGSEGRVNMARAKRRREFAPDEYPRLMEATAALNTASLWIDHTPGLTVDQMRNKLRRISYDRGPIELVVVDYLQLMTHPKARSRYEEVSYISTALKRIASEFNVAMIALSQLSRAVEQRPDKRPMMSDLRESGTIEQDADVIMLLYRPEYYHGATMKVGRGADQHVVNVEGKAEVIIAKVRDGETGNALVGFDGPHTHFHDID